MTRQRYSHNLVFITACVGMLLFGITLITLGSVAPALQEKFTLDGMGSGALFSILPFGIVTGSLVFGPFADRYGYKLIVIASCLLIFTGLQGIANAASLMVLSICVFFFGFGGGAINGATNALVSDISGDKRSANLSLLGVFFAIGALGMPLLLGVLEKYASVESIITWTAYFTSACGLGFSFVRFPEPKNREGVAFGKMAEIFKDKFLLLLALFLLCQSGFEGIINNWTTLYLTSNPEIEMQSALFALSLYVTGMAVTRLILGWLLRKIAEKAVLILSIGLLLAGNLVFAYAANYALVVTGLILLGAGLAAGFPVMLGFAGTRYAHISGTAFSLIIAIALLGNMLINYAVGIIVEKYGIDQLPKLPFVLTFFMLILSLAIVRSYTTYIQTKQSQHAGNTMAQ